VADVPVHTRMPVCHTSSSDSLCISLVLVSETFNTQKNSWEKSGKNLMGYANKKIRLIKNAKLKGAR